MGDLYLRIFQIDDGSCLVPVESAICIICLHYLSYPSTINVHLVPKEKEYIGSVYINVNNMNYSTTNCMDIPFPSSYCRLPVFSNIDKISCVAGLCAVLRQIVKITGEEWKKLLGFRESCLVACAEFSMWTKFCEVDMIECSKHITLVQGNMLPKELARLEMHLSQPIRIHNIGKLDMTDHIFVEGPNFLLSDIVIAVSVFIVVETLQCWKSSVIPLTMKWLNSVMKDCGLQDGLSLLKLSKCDNDSREFILPAVSNYSLYKSDPKRYKPRNKLFTQQCDIDESMRKVSCVSLKSYEEIYDDSFNINIEDLPVPDVPQIRLERKMQQLLNLTKAVLQVSQKDDVIIDFCCGSGHLGFIVAHFQPKCTVILLDNKEKSLNRAKEKLHSLNLRNIYIIQTNLDYCIGPFQVGVSLHACGVASDLVIQKCLKRRANFVVCPCCYGSIQSNHILKYPQSVEFCNAGLSERDYLVLGHCADQAGTDQGEKGMQIVDTDRCLAAECLGYNVRLSKLSPPTCTPRNNLIVGYLAKSVKPLN
ncbi:hypothetical protein AAG570_009372 [Ranatra chinensis]|uniref:Methyltransferase domain-containing protein n=1 Tax=Ranatra chinensis TaxID=642074 RepID=A0ABD0YPF7_9HEMI